MSRLRRPGPAGLYVGRVDLQGIGVPHHRLSEAVILRRCGQEGRRNEKHGEKEPGEEEPGKDELHGGLTARRPFKGRLTEALLVASGVPRRVGPSTLLRAGLRSVRMHRRRPAPYGTGRRGLWAVLLLSMLSIPSTVSRAALPAGPYPPPRGEAGAPAVNLQAEVGWAGWIPLRAWLPVLVHLQVSMPVDGEIVVEVPVQGYDAPLSFRRPVRLLPGAPQRIAVDVFVPDARRALTARLVASGREVTRREVPLSASRAVEAGGLALTHEPAGLEFLADLTRKIPAACITGGDPPVPWQGYAGVQLLVVRDLDERATSWSGRLTRSRRSCGPGAAGRPCGQQRLMPPCALGWRRPRSAARCHPAGRWRGRYRCGWRRCQSSTSWLCAEFSGMPVACAAAGWPYLGSRCAS